MTRTAVYAATMLATAAATAMTIATEAMPTWVRYVMRPTGGGDPYWLTIGLHASCTSDPVTPPAFSAASPLFAGASSAAPSARPSCRPFPDRATDCGTEPAEQLFCSIWITMAFLVSLAILAELVALAGFVAVLGGGRRNREIGWRVLAPLLGVVAVLQLAAMVLVVYAMHHDDRFLMPGWHLGTSWTLCTASWVVAAVAGVGLWLSAYLLPPEDDYEFLSDTEEW